MKSLLDYLPKDMVESCGMTQTPESASNAGGRSEKAALDQLRKLPQPVSVNGGSYAYHCDVTKNPSVWYASDGSEIHPKSLRELGDWLDNHEEWDSFLDGYCDVQDLLDYGTIRKRHPRDQEEHETMSMQGESVTETAKDGPVPKPVQSQISSQKYRDKKAYEKSVANGADPDWDVKEKQKAGFKWDKNTGWEKKKVKEEIQDIKKLAGLK